MIEFLVKALCLVLEGHRLVPTCGRERERRDANTLVSLLRRALIPA